jgi:hypothetical protein
MPSTCPAHAQSAAAKTAQRAQKTVACQPQLIPRLLLPVNHEHLRRYCTDSLARICQDYGVSPELSVVCHVRECTPLLSFTNALALFFVLLNIDTGLKQALLQIDPAQERKCVNFFMNLRRHVVPEFISSEACDASRFAARCEDAWQVA